MLQNSGVQREGRGQVLSARTLRAQEEEVKPWEESKWGLWHKSRSLLGTCREVQHLGPGRTQRGRTATALLGLTLSKGKKNQLSLDHPVFTIRRLKALAATGRKTAEEAADW